MVGKGRKGNARAESETAMEGARSQTIKALQAPWCEAGAGPSETPGNKLQSSERWGEILLVPKSKEAPGLPAPLASPALGWGDGPMITHQFKSRAARQPHDDDGDAIYFP